MFGDRTITYVENQSDNIAKELESVSYSNLGGIHFKLSLDESLDKGE